MMVAKGRKPEPYFLIIKHSIVLYLKSFRHVFFLALLISVLAFVPRLLSNWIGQDIVSSPHFLISEKMWFLVIYVVVLFFLVALLWRVHCVMEVRHESILEDIRVSLAKFPLILAAGLIQWIILTTIGFALVTLVLIIKNSGNDVVSTSHIFFLFMLLQILISFYLFFMFIFYLPIIVIEDLGIFSSIKKSMGLVFRNWWRTLWVQGTPVFFYAVVLFIVKYEFYLNIHIYFIRLYEPTSWIATGIQIIILALFLPWVAAGLLVQLNDLELRKLSKTAA